MSMFDKLKDMNEMRKQAKELQGALSQERVTGASHDNMFRITMDGNQQVLSVEIDDGLVGNKAQLEKGAKEAFMKASDALRKIMVSKFSSFMN